MAEKYKTDDAEYMVSYKNFCASINGAFTTYGIQKDPLATVGKITNDATTLARRKYLNFNDEEK
jgi:hypothetical protein